MAIHTPEMTATETVPADTETVAAIPADAAPVTAPDGPDTAAPDTDTPDTTDATDARVEAVLAALESLPGGSATGLGAAAGLSRVAAGKVLNQMEAEGLVRREPGVSDGTTKGRAADRWYPITPTTAAMADTAAPSDTADAPAPAPEVPDAAPDAPPMPDTDTPDADTAPASEEVSPSGIDSADPAPAAEPTDVEADLTEEAAGQGSGGVDADADASVPEAEAVAGDPAWARARAELAALVDLFSGVMSAKEEGSDVMALGCLEMAMTKVASAHRNARAALTGTAAPARAASVVHPGAGGGAGLGGSVRPGGLRELVHAHLIEFPGKEFTPHEIGRALGGRSSGAVANALDRLVQLGEAVLTTERPRRFTLAPTATPAAPTATPPNAPTGVPAAPTDASAEDRAATDGYGG